MRVAYIVAEFPSLTETFVLREMEALQRRGVDIELFALRRAPPGTPVHAAAQAWAGRVCYARNATPAWCLRHGLASLCRFPGRGFRGALGAFQGSRLRPRPVLAGLWHAATAAAFAHEAARRGVEHIHAEFAFVTADVARAMAARLGCRFSVAAHAWDVYTQSPAALARRLAASAFIAVCTDDARQHLEAALPRETAGRLHLVRHGLDFAAAAPPAAPSLEAEVPLILGVGRLEEKKGFCYLIDACDLLRERGVTFRCVIAGDGPLRGALARMVEALDLQGCIEFPGRLSQEDLAGLYARAAILVQPSVVARNGDRDGLSNAVLEGMAAGLPVVSTTAAAAGEAMADGETGFLVPPHNSGALADPIEKLLRNPQLRRRIGAAAQARVRKEFDIGRNTEDLMTLFRQAFGGG